MERCAVLLAAVLALLNRRRRAAHGGGEKHSVQLKPTSAAIELCTSVNSLKVVWPTISASTENSNAAISRAVNLIHDQGLCWMPGILPHELLAECLSCAQNNFRSCLDKIENGGYRLGIGIANGFEEIVQRHEGRFDMQVRCFKALFVNLVHICHAVQNEKSAVHRQIHYTQFEAVADPQGCSWRRL